MGFGKFPLLRFFQDYKGTAFIVNFSILCNGTSVIFLALGLLFASVARLEAYADPGSGALFLQVVSAGIVGALFYCRKVTNWVKRFVVYDKDRPER